MKSISMDTHLTAWDKKYLKKHNCLSLTDKHGRDRNANQNLLVRVVDEKNKFDQVLIGIAYRVVTKCFDLNIGVIATFQINSFVSADPKNEKMVNQVIAEVMEEFKRGDKFPLELSQMVALSQDLILETLIKYQEFIDSNHIQ